MSDTTKTAPATTIETPLESPSTVMPNGAEPEAQRTAETPPRRRGGTRRTLLFAIAVVVIAIAGYFGYNFWRSNQLYVSTDDALVDSNLVAIAAPTSGTLTNWQIRPGDRVRAGQILGTVRAAPSGLNAPVINITAPQDGTILKVDGKAGQIIGAAQAIAYMADLNALTITAYINETDVHRVRPGQFVDATVDGTGGEQYHGVVSEVIPATASEFALIQTQDRGSGNFTKVAQRIEVHVDLGDTSGTGLYPGMNAQVHIHVT